MKFGVMFQFISVFLLLYVFVGIQVQPCPPGACAADVVLGRWGVVWKDQAIWGRVLLKAPVLLWSLLIKTPGTEEATQVHCTEIHVLIWNALYESFFFLVSRCAASDFIWSTIVNLSVSKILWMREPGALKLLYLWPTIKVIGANNKM